MCSGLQEDEDGLLPEWVVYHELVSTSRPFLRQVRVCVCVCVCVCGFRRLYLPSQGFHKTISVCVRVCVCVWCHAEDSSGRSNALVLRATGGYIVAGILGLIRECECVPRMVVCVCFLCHQNCR